ncbi:MAG: hypothetical protein WD939_06075 [Dehalococcoidia bacterium]
MTTDQPYLMLLYRRVFSSRDPGLVQLSFDARVLDRYRGANGYSLIRTDTVGRVTREGGWTIDVGIGDEGRTVHASLRDLLDALPDEERDHWAQHAIALPMSERFLQMRMVAGACIDDGEVREWE